MKQMVQLTLRFWNNRTGNIAVNFAILVVPLIGVAGVALDFSQLSRHHMTAQDALDAAVLAGVTKQGSDDVRISVATSHFYDNLKTEMRVSAPKFEWKNGGGRLDGIVNINTDQTLSKVIGVDGLKSTVTSAAILTRSGYRCLHALNSNVSKALIYNNKRGPLQYTGNSIIAQKCDVQVNSSSSAALFVKEEEGYEFARHCIVGGVSGEVDSISPAPDSSCKKSLADPFAARVLPTAPASCTDGGGVLVAGGGGGDDDDEDDDDDKKGKKDKKAKKGKKPLNLL